jgi:hypothetical protein
MYVLTLYRTHGATKHQGYLILEASVSPDMIIYLQKEVGNGINSVVVDPPYNLQTKDLILVRCTAHEVLKS